MRPHLPPYALIASLAALGGHAHATSTGGIEFHHHDWELACDNTGTCRAAGYQEMDGDRSISVLLTRKAGPDQPIAAQVMVGHYGDDAIPSDLPDPFPLTLHIDGRPIGQVRIGHQAFSADLPPAQVTALLATLRRSSSIEWRSGAHRWRLSDRGATAVLLKMDEHQGRLGTPGALVRRGTRPEAEVPPAKPAPRIAAPRLVAAKPDDRRYATTPPAGLMASLRAAIPRDACTPREEPEAPLALEVMRLSEHRLLLSASCWGAAYNFGQIVWVVSDQPPYEPVVVTTDASHIDDDGTVVAQHKGRGLGDCWSSESWTWTSEAYVRSSAMTTGKCRLVAPGGTWTLPTLVSEVTRASRSAAKPPGN